jgi:3,4-dihydroxy 2-butanone 4-phosphate synthase/GTP cyclohydrolase II
MPLNTVEELIEDIRAGRMVILMDDEDRENEGDLVMAATHVRPEDINFMASHGRGLICLTVTRDRCRQLDLPLMVQGNESLHSTNFTISIEAAEGVTTGISAHDRARTIQAAVGPDAGPRDIVQPGHIFPLMAQPGGVLTRAGHTEAGCDLARLAGLEPAAVIVEILKEDGSMARRPDLERYAREHDLKMGTIEDLIRYRTENETTVERVTSCELATEHGVFTLYAYRDTVDDAVHLALVKGKIKPDDAQCAGTHCPGGQRGGRDIALGQRRGCPDQQYQGVSCAGAAAAGQVHEGAAGAAHLRCRRPDYRGPRREKDARAERAQDRARHRRFRARGG